MCDVLMVAIPKDPSAVPLPMKVRLIAVTSHLYRIWAGSARAKVLQRQWLHDILPDDVVGGRLGFSTLDAMAKEECAWDQAIVEEHA